MTEENEVLLRVDNLCQYFRMSDGEYNKAVDGISFEVKKGEVFGLVGESGCGKTTTGRSIIGLYDITDGDIYFKGVRVASGTFGDEKKIYEGRREYKRLLRDLKSDEDAVLLKGEHRTRLGELRESIRFKKGVKKRADKEYSERLLNEADEKYRPLLSAVSDSDSRRKIEKEYKNERRKAKRSRLLTEIQMIFQDPIASLDPRMTVGEIISEGLIIRGERDKESINERVRETLRLVGLVPECLGRYPHEFSGGQRQRIGIARAIIMNPQMIIADEPVSALDVSVQAQVINLINDLRRRLGLTVLFVAHDLSVVKYFSDRIAVMYYGKIVELADADELFQNPLHPYTKSLLSAIPLPDPIYERQRERIRYNDLEDHDYSSDKPRMREVARGHFVYCNGAEFERYIKESEIRGSDER